MTKRKPINVKVWQRATTLAAENVLSRNSANGSIGLLVVFSLINKNRKKRILTVYAASISGDVLPRLLPSIKAKVTIPRASTLATCPGRSRPRPACGVDGATYREVSRKPRMPMGRLIRKMLRQPNALTNTPPKRGPERDPMLATVAQMTIAHARFLASGKIVCKRASEFGTTRDPRERGFPCLLILPRFGVAHVY